MRAVQWRGVGRTAGRQMRLVSEGAVRTAKAQVGEGCGSTRTPWLGEVGGAQSEGGGEQGESGGERGEGGVEGGANRGR